MNGSRNGKIQENKVNSYCDKSCSDPCDNPKHKTYNSAPPKDTTRSSLSHCYSPYPAEENWDDTADQDYDYKSSCCGQSNHHQQENEEWVVVECPNKHKSMASDGKYKCKSNNRMTYKKTTKSPTSSKRYNCDYYEEQHFRPTVNICGKPSPPPCSNYECDYYENEKPLVRANTYTVFNCSQESIPDDIHCPAAKSQCKLSNNNCECYSSTTIKSRGSCSCQQLRSNNKDPSEKCNNNSTEKSKSCMEEMKAMCICRELPNTACLLPKAADVNRPACTCPTAHDRDNCRCSLLVSSTGYNMSQDRRQKQREQCCKRMCPNHQEDFVDLYKGGGGHRSRSPCMTVDKQVCTVQSIACNTTPRRRNSRSPSVGKNINKTKVTCTKSTTCAMPKSGTKECPASSRSGNKASTYDFESDFCYDTLSCSSIPCCPTTTKVSRAVSRCNIPSKKCIKTMTKSTSCDPDCPFIIRQIQEILRKQGCSKPKSMPPISCRLARLASPKGRAKEVITCKNLQKNSAKCDSGCPTPKKTCRARTPQKPTCCPKFPKTVDKSISCFSICGKQANGKKLGEENSETGKHVTIVQVVVHTPKGAQGGESKMEMVKEAVIKGNNTAVRTHSTGSVSIKDTKQSSNCDKFRILDGTEVEVKLPPPSDETLLSKCTLNTKDSKQPCKPMQIAQPTVAKTESCRTGQKQSVSPQNSCSAIQAENNNKEDIKASCDNNKEQKKSEFLLCSESACSKPSDSKSKSCVSTSMSDTSIFTSNECEPCFKKFVSVMSSTVEETQGATSGQQNTNGSKIMCACDKSTNTEEMLVCSTEAQWGSKQDKQEGKVKFGCASDDSYCFKHI